MEDKMATATKQSKYTEEKFLRDIEKILDTFNIPQLKDVLKYEDIIIPEYSPKYTKEYFIQNYENNLIRQGVEDHVAIRCLINCTAKESRELVNEQNKKKMSPILPRYRLNQFLEYVDSLIDKKKKNYSNIQIVIV
jgi:hypothetical protein